MDIRKTLSQCAKTVARSLILCVGLTVFSGEVFAQASSSSLEIQALQSRDFETTKEIAFNSVISVLQDSGYVIDSADLLTGFVTGTSPTGSYGNPDKSKKPKKKKRSYSKGTAFVEKIAADRVRVRLNFIEIRERYNLSSELLRLDVPIEDPLVYQNAFEAISKAIFIRSSSE